MIDNSIDYFICVYDENMDDFIEGKVTHLSDYKINIKLERPYVYWVSQNVITHAHSKKGKEFLDVYPKLCETLLYTAYNKVKYIADNIDDIEEAYLILQENLYELETLSNKPIARRIKRTLEEDFFRRGVLNENVHGICFNTYDHELILDIVKAYSVDKTKIYLPSS